MAQTQTQTQVAASQPTTSTTPLDADISAAQRIAARDIEEVIRNQSVQAFRAWLVDRPRVREKIAAQKSANDYTVELCERRTTVPGLRQLNVQHWWLRSADFELGMGEKDGGVPDKPGASHIPRTLRTTLNDHTGEGVVDGAVCTPVAAINPAWQHEMRDCLLAEMQEGKDTGLWVPPINDCHEVVKDILNKCAAPEHERVVAPDSGVSLPMGTDIVDGGTP